MGLGPISRLAYAAALALLFAPPALAREDTAVVTHHRYRIGTGSIDAIAEAGRVAIRDDKSGAISGHMFFTAYRVRGAHRPVTFLWNGGPGANSSALHFEAFGPRTLSANSFADNAQSLLDASDLVFVDPIGTGFSRATAPKYEKMFYSTLGDFASVAQFVRRWLVERHATGAPVYLVGESFGVWRAAAVAQLLEERGQRVAGIVLISGGAGVGTGVVPRNLAIALRTPGRTATALAAGRLSPDLKPDAAVAQATTWSRDVYAPALAHAEALSDVQREAIATDLARFTGFPLAAIDRKTLAITPRQYLNGAIPENVLDTFDMRRTNEPAVDGAAIDHYLRTELGYETKLAYAGLGLDTAADPSAPKGDAINRNWDYNSGVITPEIMAAAIAGEGPPGSQPWALNAVKRDPKLRVLVAAGLYDSLNSCAANDELLKALEPTDAKAFTMKCYSGGHMMYRDPAAHAALTADVTAFIKK